jgi:hypothetical protein
VLGVGPLLADHCHLGQVPGDFILDWWDTLINGGHWSCYPSLSNLAREKGESLPLVRARETITPCFGTPIHPAWRRCENLKDNEYSCVSAPCQTGASTPQIQGLIISRALSPTSITLVVLPVFTRWVSVGPPKRNP